MDPALQLRAVASNALPPINPITYPKQASEYSFSNTRFLFTQNPTLRRDQAVYQLISLGGSQGVTTKNAQNPETICCSL